MANLVNEFIGAYTRQMARNVANTDYNEKTTVVNSDDSFGKIVNREYSDGSTGVQFEFDKVSLSYGWPIAWAIFVLLPLVLNQIIAIPFLLYLAIKNLIANKIEFLHTTIGDAYTMDRRYRSGARHEFTNITDFSKQKVSELRKVTDFRINPTVKNSIEETERMREVGYDNVINGWVKKARIRGVIYSVLLVYSILIVKWIMSFGG